MRKRPGRLHTILLLFFFIVSIETTQVHAEELSTFIMGSEASEYGHISCLPAQQLTSNKDNSGWNLQQSTDYPEHYDLREEGRVSSVRHQGTEGTCWAHAAIASIESSILTKKLNLYSNFDPAISQYTSETLDFSEKHMVWNSIGSVSEDENDLMYDDGIIVSNPYTTGGNWIFCASALARGNGVEYEAYGKSEKTKPVFDDASRYVSYARLKSVRVLDSTDSQQKINSIKDALMNRGVVDISYYSSSSYYQMNDTYGTSYYNPNATSSNSNHSVAIVGWDDAYSAENFKSQPSSDGAWLVKNSWGPAWKNMNGYFWMSYEEPSLCEIVSFEMQEQEAYDYTYQYDFMEGIYAISTSKYANIFTSTEDETLTQIGFFYSFPDTEYSVSIYKKSNATMGSPTDGTLVATLSGILPYYGYQNLSLTEEIPLSTGDSFSVILSLSGTYNSNTISYGVFEGPASTYDSMLSAVTFENKVKSSSGQTYYYSGNKWVAASSTQNNACIKAFTKRTNTSMVRNLEAAINDVKNRNYLGYSVSQKERFLSLYDHSKEVLNDPVATWQMLKNLAYHLTYESDEVLENSATSDMIVGDLNADGKISAVDALEMLLYYREGFLISDETLPYLDINEDTKADENDVIALLERITE
ncbi:MAG: C1 family peptidase [Lachnospiraceae bacterium]